MSPKSLSEQVVLLTGASTGIGAALAVTLAIANPGIRLILVARNRSQLEVVATSCRQHGAKVTIIPTDLADVEQTKSLAINAIGVYGSIDILVNNAGYGQMGPVELIPL